MGSFDKAAKDYDAQFTNTCVGKAQRSQVWNELNRLFPDSTSTVLEINCGTGKDASLWYKKGHAILATDGSQEMINVAKHNHAEIDFELLDINKISNHRSNYDALFSNFGGLNCLSKEELKAFFESAHHLINKNGRLALVIMGRKCFWDRLFLVLKGRNKERNRRNTSNALTVNVDGEDVSTWYYSPSEVSRLAESHFKVERMKPIGLFVPPSYLAKTFEKRPRTFGFLKFLDKYLSFPFLSNHADHYFISLKKLDK